LKAPVIYPLWSTPAIAVVVWALWFLQRKFPVEPEQPSAAVIADWKLVGLRIVMTQLIGPIAKASAIMIINATGGGWIHLRSDGWWFLVSVIVVILATDFWSYLLHRAEHKFPVLWAMHSLHHSAEALSMITGARHFWLESAINTAVFPVIGIVFKIPAEVVTTVAVIYLVPDGLLPHLNVRMSLGRFALCIQNPQYHRIHHSLEPHHFNKNFCKMLPLFDVIFGTAWKPGKDEFPKTGLADERATGFLDGIIWPVRQRLSWRSSGPTVATGTGDLLR
jgi:sterol desaturase/sphingolipid hydroxylase (fatty acid hydroxylase superfamily)